MVIFRFPDGDAGDAGQEEEGRGEAEIHPALEYQVNARKQGPTVHRSEAIHQGIGQTGKCPLIGL